jgi:hypothetical protein
MCQVNHQLTCVPCLNVSLWTFKALQPPKATMQPPVVTGPHVTSFRLEPSSLTHTRPPVTMEPLAILFRPEPPSLTRTGHSVTTGPLAISFWPEPPSLTRTGPLVTTGPPAILFRSNLRPPTKTRSKLAWVRVKSEAPRTRWGFVGKILMDLRPASPTVLNCTFNFELHFIIF